MLRFLRKKGVMKKILWATAVVIILAFGVFGVGDLSTNNGRKGYAGKIFGKTISLAVFRENSLHTRSQAIIRHGENFNKIQQSIDFNAQTWDRMILLHEAKRRRLKIKNEEIIKVIHQQPFFERDGRFDSFLYHDIVKYVFQ